MKNILATILFFSLIFGINPKVFAKEKNNYAPETEFAVEGEYDVKGRPDLKVRVIIHKEKISPEILELQVCGLTDPDSNSLPGLKTWYLPPTFKYNLNPGSVPTSVGSQNLNTIVTNAFGVWENALGGMSPVISRGSDTISTKARLDSKNLIAWGKVPPGVLAVTYVTHYLGGYALEIDTVFTQRASWQWTWNGGGTACADNNTYDVQNFMTNELGHWFGLDDEFGDDFINSTMFGIIAKGEVKKNTLTTGDILKINSVY